jgi:hypothetical protein
MITVLLVTKDGMISRADEPTSQQSVLLSSPAPSGLRTFDLDPVHASDFTNHFNVLPSAKFLTVGLGLLSFTSLYTIIARPRVLVCDCIGMV